VCFSHVSPYSIEPYRDSRSFSASPNLSDNCGAGDLLAEHDGGSASSNEVCKSGPKVAVVRRSFSCPGATERLARATSRPDSAGVFEPGPFKGEGPHSDPAEHVYLVISGEFVWSDFKDAPFVYVSRWQAAGGDQLAQPRASFFVTVVVVVHLAFL
jgi:hypothetical protein